MKLLFSTPIGRLALVLFLIIFHNEYALSQVYTVGTMQAWTGNGITGIGIGADGSEAVECQTFRINNGSALVNNISFPIWPYAPRENPGLSQLLFQVGVVAWSGSRPTGPFLYLSEQLAAPVGGFRTITVNPPGLLLNQGQEYALVFTPQNYVAADWGSLSVLGYVDRSSYLDGQMFIFGGRNLGFNDLYNRDWQASSANAAFSVNYQIASVPEPNAALLLCLALAFLWRACRKQAGCAA